MTPVAFEPSLVVSFKGTPLLSEPHFASLTSKKSVSCQPTCQAVVMSFSEDLAILLDGLTGWWAGSLSPSCSAPSPLNALFLPSLGHFLKKVLLFQCHMQCLFPARSHKQYLSAGCSEHTLHTLRVRDSSFYTVDVPKSGPLRLKFDEISCTGRFAHLILSVELRVLVLNVTRGL